MKKKNFNLICGSAITLFVLLFVGAGFLWTPWDPNAMDETARFAGVSLSHPFGCDNFGRDLLSRVMKGGGMTLAIAAATVAFGVAPVFSDGEEIYAFMVLFLCCACLFTATVMPYAVRFLCFLHGKIRGTGTSYIAAQNATAAPFAARTATALALLISFVFTASMLIDVVKVLSSPAQKRFGFDIVVVDDNIQTKADADEAFVKYSAMDGVDAVYVTTKKIIRFIDDHPDINFRSTFIIGLRNGDDLRRFCKGTDDDTVRRFDDESTDFPVVISYYIADELGLSVGDTYILANADISPRELTVVGIDYTASNFDMYIYTRFDVCNTFSPQAPIVYIDAAGATTADFAQYADGNTVLVFDGDNYNMDSTTFSMDGLPFKAKLSMPASTSRTSL